MSTEQPSLIGWRAGTTTICLLDSVSFLSFLLTVFKQKHSVSYAGAYYNLSLFRLQSQLQHLYHGQPYARVDLNPTPESTLSPSQGLRIWPLAFRHLRENEKKCTSCRICSSYLKTGLIMIQSTRSGLFMLRCHFL